MRLLSTDLSDGLQLADFPPSDIPPYAILSHTWEQDEVLYGDVISGTAAIRTGYAKLRDACRRALADDFAYIWIDTCCIDKSSSAELSEAINSMFAWYRDSDVCYAFLSDFAPRQESVSLADCRWFTRGWTLQELIAPQTVLFYDAAWNKVGDKVLLAQEISSITRIDEDVLTGATSIDTSSVANRMGWAARRRTTRPEDIAYCLMGLFSVNMPLLYGEGIKAFARLQEEIMKGSTDPSLFVWVDEEAPDDKQYGLLAPSPRCFDTTYLTRPYVQWQEPAPYAMTNEGLSIEVMILQTLEKDHNGGYLYQAILNCPPPHISNIGTKATTFYTVFLTRHNLNVHRYARVKASQLGFRSFDRPKQVAEQEVSHIYIRPRPESDTRTIFPWYYLHAPACPPPQIYKITGILRLGSGDRRPGAVRITNKSQGEYIWGFKQLIEVRRGPLLSIDFERQSDGQAVRVVILGDNTAGLDFYAEEIGDSDDTAKSEPAVALRELEIRARPTPIGETLSLPQHNVTVQVDKAKRNLSLTKFYSLTIGIDPVESDAGAASLHQPAKKGRLRQIFGSSR
jgi:hypothetical protein